MRQNKDRVTQLFEYNFFVPLNEEDDEETAVSSEEDIEDIDMESGDDLDDVAMDDMPVDEEMPTDDMPVDDMDDTEEVEIDISELVDKIEANQTSIENTESTVDTLKSSMEDYVSKIGQNQNDIIKMMKGMSDNLKKELIKRMPTPNEKIETNSKYAYPYHVKLTDYFQYIDKDKTKAEHNSNMEPMEQPEEYVLTQGDIDNMNDFDIMKSL